MSEPLPPADEAPAAELAERVPPIIRLLTRAVQREPDAAVHYLLRGEEWLLRGEFARAQADLERARALAARDLARSDWGYIDQAYQDRAEAALRQCAGATNTNA